MPTNNLTQLKPQKLNRHYHKIPHYIRELSSKYPRIISDYFLHNYRINLELLQIKIHEQVNKKAKYLYHSPLNKIDFTIDLS